MTGGRLQDVDVILFRPIQMVGSHQQQAAQGRRFLPADAAQGGDIGARLASGQRGGDFRGHDFAPLQRPGPFHNKGEAHDRRGGQENINSYVHRGVIRENKLNNNKT